MNEILKYFPHLSEEQQRQYDPEDTAVAEFGDERHDLVHDIAAQMRLDPIQKLKFPIHRFNILSMNCMMQQ